MSKFNKLLNKYSEIYHKLYNLLEIELRNKYKNDYFKQSSEEFYIKDEKFTIVFGDDIIYLKNDHASDECFSIEDVFNFIDLCIKVMS